MNDFRRLRNGYSNFGPIQIPPLAQGIVLTDRADGTKWLVSFNASAPERLSIVSTYDTISHREGVRIYEADDGPKMDEDGEYTLIIRSGHIGFDFIPFPRRVSARDDAPPYARQISSQRKLKMDNLVFSALHIGYTT